MLGVVMRRLAAIPMSVLLLAVMPALAQNADPFHEVAPTTVLAPVKDDPFQMAPADPVPVPKTPPPLPRRVREPEPETVVTTPPAPPPPAPNAKCFTFNNKQFCE